MTVDDEVAPRSRGASAPIPIRSAPHEGGAPPVPGVAGAARDRRRGIALILVGTFLWSTTGLLMDRLLTAYPITPLVLSWWRILIVSVALGGAVALRQPGAFRLSRREALYYGAYGLICIALFNVVWSESVQVNKAAVGVALVFSAPAFVALADRLLFGKRLRVVQGGAVAANLLGCVLVSGVSGPAAVIARPAGLALGLATGMIFAAYTLFGKGATRLGPRSSLSILFYAFFFATIGLTAWGLPAAGVGLIRPPLDAAGWGLLLGLALGPTICGYLCFTSSLRYLPATVASLFTTLELPLAAVLASIVLGRAMSGLQWCGAALIVAAVAAVQVSTMERA